MLPPHLTTFQITRPSHVVTCAESGCTYYLNGWRTIVDAGKAELVRRLRGYSFTEARTPDGLFEFTFPAGQECFDSRSGDPDRAHRQGWDGRERLFERTAWGHREHVRADDWVDSFANNQIRVAEIAERG